MRPYFERDGITIYHADCRDVLPTLEPGSVDLVLTDPPFFMPATHYQTRIRQQRTWGDTSILSTFWTVILDAAVPTLKDTGHFLTFCHGESYPVFYPEMYRRFDTLACLVWDKEHFGMGRVWRRQHELIIAGRWKSAALHEGAGAIADVIRAKATPAVLRQHPVEKPPLLLQRLITPTTPRAGLVVDPFMGSGTTVEAAITLGRHAIGIEIEERYCEIAAKRLQQAVLPLAMSAD